MKKKHLTKFIILTLILTAACSKKSNKLKITDFSKSTYDTLFPNTNNNILFSDSYAVQLFRIVGESNDTIRINFGGIEKKYVGDFTDKWAADYYGAMPVHFKFDPYKADEGKIIVDYSIE
ncbi:hypothetical protein [uncultured Croceitalea sp.]|uniref:hypothetical protein n=1 Tax=uncultured Croceitalea sp. TaxID=1798908 RepID=UPI0033064D85